MGLGVTTPCQGPHLALQCSPHSVTAGHWCEQAFSAQAGLHQLLPRAGGCSQGTCIQPLQKWVSATYPERVHCSEWLGMQRQLSSGQVQAYQQITSSREQHWEAAQWQSTNFLATIFKSTFTSLFSTCRTQINQKHQPVVAKGSYCFVAFLIPIANEIILLNLPSQKKPPIQLCVWSCFYSSMLPLMDFWSWLSILQCFFRSCFIVGKCAWTVMGTQVIRWNVLCVMLEQSLPLSTADPHNTTSNSE